MNPSQRLILQLTVAIGLGAPVTFVYTDTDGVTSFRDVVPLGIEQGADTGTLIVKAFDRQRQGPRNFRFDRIRVS